jgi:hypothetical protein
MLEEGELESAESQKLQSLIEVCLEAGVMSQDQAKEIMAMHDGGNTIQYRIDYVMDFYKRPNPNIQSHLNEEGVSFGELSVPPASH